MSYDRTRLKEEVKHDISQTRPKAILVTLVYLMAAGLVSILLGAAEQVFMPSGVMNDLVHIMQLVEMGLISSEEALLELAELAGDFGRIASISTLFGLLTNIVGWTLGFGYQGYCLGMVRRENPGFARLLCALPQWGWVLLTGLLVALFTTLWAILFCLIAGAVTVAAVLLLSENAALAATLSVAAWVAAIVAMVPITLRYAMSNYILLDEKTDALEAISRSKAMMRGRKWHLFVLYLSFLGWYLLLGLIVGMVGGVGGLVGGAALSDDPMMLLNGTSLIMVALMWVASIPLSIWLNAYATGAEAKFYDWMRMVDQDGGVWESDRQYQAPYIPQYDPRRQNPPGHRRPEPPRRPPERPDYE